MSTEFFRQIYGNYDIPEGLTDTEHKTVPVESTPYQRVIKTFTPNEFGEFGDAVNTIFEVSAMSMFIGGVYGGVMSSKTTYLEFFQNNQATAFKDHLEAKKRLQDKITLSFGRGAWRLAWRLTLFSTSYITFTTALSTYRGKNGILEHIIAGGTAGSLYKFNGGPRQMLVGGVLGSSLGLIAGGVTLLLLKISGMEMSDVQANSKRWQALRMGKMQLDLKEHYAKKDDEAELQEHSKRDQLAIDLDALAKQSLEEEEAKKKQS